MCMKYVNAITTCYMSVDKDKDNNVISFNNPFIGVFGEKFEENNSTRYKLNKFYICLNATFLGTSDNEKIQESVLSSLDTIEVVIRLTKLSKQVEERDYIDLEKFTLNFKDLAEAKQLDLACFDYYSLNKVIEVNDLTVPVVGKYVIKVIIRRQSDSSETVQNVSSFFVSE